MTGTPPRRQQARQVARRIPGAWTTYHYARFGAILVRRGLWGRLFNRDSSSPLRQRVIRWDLGRVALGDAPDLPQALRDAGLTYHEGHHTVYVPPQSGRENFFGDAAAFYDDNVGFKLLKNMSPADGDSYLVDDRRHALRDRLTGGPASLVVAGNYLNHVNLGPRIWDICELDFEDVLTTCFVVEHVEGGTPTSVQHQSFLHELRTELANGPLHVLYPGWERTADFSELNCNGNLIAESNSGHTRYVDFQNFGFAKPGAWVDIVAEEKAAVFHFGDPRPYRKNRFAYQSIPGSVGAAKRDTNVRWALIKRLLDDSGVTLEGTVALDVGCNSGMILARCLTDGAYWGVGWDLPHVADAATELLLSLGMSRFHLVGRDLKDGNPLEPDMPNFLARQQRDIILFYLSVHDHIGMIPSLATIPWRALVFEGHQGQTASDLLSRIEDSVPLSDCMMLHDRTVDGESGPRPVVVLSRPPPRAMSLEVNRSVSTMR